MPDRIEPARNTSARFYRADLHLHSPLSHDWNNEARNGYSPDPLFSRINRPEDIKEAVLAAYYEAIRKSGLNIVAITDHMKWSFGVALAEYSQKQSDPVLVLPGIEINVRFEQPLLRDYRIHVLAIFPPDIGRTRIDSIFPNGFPDEFRRDGRTDTVSFNDIEELVKKIRGHKGYAIAAHIYGNHGVRLAFTKQTRLILTCLKDEDEREDLYRKIGDEIKDELYKFDCLQVTETTDPIHFKNANGVQAIPLVCCSDSHHITLFGDTSKLTYLKLGKPDFSCFGEAFRYPDTRIRFKGNLPDIEPPRLRGIRIFGKKDNEKSFFQDLVIGFSDNLTCLVGPRGSGKSAVIDAIRYAMGYNRNLQGFAQVRDQVKNRQKNTLHASRIEILYEKVDRQMHKIVATYDEREEYTTQVFDLNDTLLNIPDVETSGEYPLNLYGWNELELLGEDPRSQRDNLDRFIKTLPALKSERAELYAALEDNGTICDRQLGVLDKIIEPPQQKQSFLRLTEYETEFNKLNTPEIDSTFKQLDSINHRLTFIAGLKAQLGTALGSLNHLPLLSVEDIHGEMEGEKEWCIAFVEEELNFEEFNCLATRYRKALERKLNGILAGVEQKEQTLILELSKVTKSIKETVGEEESISADLRNNAKKRFDTAKENFEHYKQELARFEKMLVERREITEKIQQINKTIFTTRENEISAIKTRIQVVEDENFQIDLYLAQEQDKKELYNALQTNAVEVNYEGLQWRRRKLPELLSHKMTPFGVSSAIFHNDVSALLHEIELSEAGGNQKYTLDDETAQKIINANNPVEEIEGLGTKRYLREKLKRLFKIEQLPFDDSFYIVLNGRPIQHCSPGQRCSAMLPIVTLTSDAPIIIDQPEDNLDNRLVSKAVFKILSKLKETRQIILATHNPNILVSGDSEQVVVLRSDGNVDDFGSIDEPSIVTNIIELMEGGREAFERRQTKYGMHGK